MESTVVPGAASTTAPGWLHDVEAPALVLAAYPGAAYLLPVGSQPDASVEVLALVDGDALRLPGSVLVPGAGDLARLRLGQADAVAVGAGRVRTGSAVLEVRRRWTPRAVVPVDAGHLSVAAVSRVAEEIDLASRRPGRDDLAGLAADVLVDPAGAARLLGLGPGLTPSGDDVLCGVMLALRAVGRHESALAVELEQQVLGGLARTTALSGTLLRAAARGHAVPQVVDLLDLLRESDLSGAVRTRVSAVAAIGHSSGVDLLVGVRAVLALCLGTAGQLPPPISSHPEPSLREA